MTENEAIEKINRLNDALNEQRFDAGENSEALQIAIKALEEVQQYRAIGTPEECRAAVKKQKKKNPIRLDKCTCPAGYKYIENVRNI